MQKYHDFMNEHLQMGVKQPIELACQEDACFYSPLCLVFTRSWRTTKNICVVFDVSTKSSIGLSLNAILQVWPAIQDDL